MKHTNSVAVITGASSGIGLGLTQGFLQAGYHVVANSRHLTQTGTLTPSPQLALVEGDVAEPETASRIVRTAVERFGTVDLLINNAGIFVPKAFTDFTEADYARVTGTNLAGPFYLSQAAVRQMKKQGGGHILNVTTTLAQQPVAGVNAALTSLTKGGLNALTRGLAIEHAADNIRVNAIAPGIIDTPMHAPENHEFLKGLHPIRRLGTVEEIVEAALFLARAPFITGEILHVDGGAHAGKW
jgi:NAD(P)-dependent dehydrogenase (short-subunit alcohol dehydrogenase family)